MQGLNGQRGLLVAPRPKESLAALKFQHESAYHAAGRHRDEARRQLAELLEETSTGPESVTNELLQRLHPPDFDLTGLSHDQAAAVEDMPPQAWAVLHRYAEAGGGPGITGVTLSASFLVENLVPGLLQLPELRRVALGHEPDAEQLASLAQLPAHVQVYLRAGAGDSPTLGDNATQASGLGAPGPARARPAATTPIAAARAVVAAWSQLQAAIVGKRGLDDIQQGFGRVLALLAQQPPGTLDLDLANVLKEAVESGCDPAVRAFVRAVAEAPEALDPGRRRALLLACHAPASVPRARPADAAHGPRYLPPDCLGGLPEFEEDAPEAGEPRPPRPESAAAACGPDAPVSPRPMLSRVCNTPGDASPLAAGVLARYGAMFAFLEEVLYSPALSFDAKKAICASAYTGGDGQPVTAARLALQHGSPGAAAAMLCAILESRVPADGKEALVAALGVGPEQMLAALVPRVNEPWVQQMGSRIAGAADALELLKGSALVKMDGWEGRYADQCRLAGLRAEHVRFSGRLTKLVCSADEEIKALQIYRLPEADACQKTNDRPYWYAIVPQWLRSVDDEAPGPGARAMFNGASLRA